MSLMTEKLLLVSIRDADLIFEGQVDCLADVFSSRLSGPRFATLAISDPRQATPISAPSSFQRRLRSLFDAGVAICPWLVSPKHSPKLRPDNYQGALSETAGARVAWWRGKLWPMLTH